MILQLIAIRRSSFDIRKANDEKRVAAKTGQASKGIGWMPWHQEPMKDGASADTPRVAASRR